MTPVGIFRQLAAIRIEFSSRARPRPETSLPRPTAFCSPPIRRCAVARRSRPPTRGKAAARAAAPFPDSQTLTLQLDAAAGAWNLSFDTADVGTVSDTSAGGDSGARLDDLANGLVELGVPHSKPRNAGRPREVPDFVVKGVVVEVAGRGRRSGGGHLRGGRGARRRTSRSAAVGDGMPELPEVETVMRGLASVLEGRVIRAASAGSPRQKLGTPDVPASWWWGP